jgi:2-polyprenyl-3-methyl-5-hydroxy-6-metoxy-1,4-benzoquinol methylase
MQRGTYHKSIIMDIGCGKDLPLPRLMYANRMTGFAYIGVDMNDLMMPEMLATAVNNNKAEIQLLERSDASKITEDDLEFPPPDFVTCFEVVEHVHPEILRQLLYNIWQLTDTNAHYYFSTPIFNGSAAANHINEMTYCDFGYALEYCGFTHVENFGTFASQTEIKDTVDKNRHNVFSELGKYYDSNVLSTIFAPLYPELSRNVIWHVKKAREGDARDFQPDYKSQNAEAFKEEFPHGGVS